MKLILGTVQFGLNYGINNSNGKPSESQVFEMLDFAYQNDIDTLDTADAYGDAIDIIGRYHKSRTHINFKINSKFQLRDNLLSEKLDLSLKILDVKFINTYFFHDFKDYKNNNSIFETLNKFKIENKIKKIGISIYDNFQLQEVINDPRIDVIQLPYNLLDNYNIRGSLLEKAKKNKKEIQVRSVFLQGLFLKELNSIPKKINNLKPYLVKISEISNHFSISIDKLALQYALSEKNIDNVIIGSDNISQLKKNIKFSNEKLDITTLEEVNKIQVIETDLLFPYNWI